MFVFVPDPLEEEIAIHSRNLDGKFHGLSGAWQARVHGAAKSYLIKRLSTYTLDLKLLYRFIKVIEIGYILMHAI